MSDLRVALEAAQGESRAALKAKDDRIASLMEEVAAAAATAEELKAELAQVGRGWVWIAALRQWLVMEDRSAGSVAASCEQGTYSLQHNALRRGVQGQLTRDMEHSPLPSPGGVCCCRAQVSALQEELEELREMKADIQRKEKQQAAIIENQVRLPAWLSSCGTWCAEVHYQ